MNNEEKILELLTAMQADISGLKTDVAGLKTDVADLKTDVSDMKTRLIRVEVTQESIVLPQLQALAEGQQTILDTLAPKNRVEALEDEMVFMKTVIRSMAEQIDALQKAQ